MRFQDLIKLFQITEILILNPFKENSRLKQPLLGQQTVAWWQQLGSFSNGVEKFNRQVRSRI